MEPPEVVLSWDRERNGIERNMRGIVTVCVERPLFVLLVPSTASRQVL